MTQLFIHIGGGKTGSSSLQATLASNAEALSREGISYWGLMLENAPIKRHEWQRPSGTMSYYKTQDSERDLTRIISESLEEEKERGTKMVIWSNEWLLGSGDQFKRNMATISAIEKLVDEGQRITVIAYIREHLSWAVSAYFQWGIKHKTYRGDILSFKDFITSRPPRFSTPLRAWKDATRGRLALYNFHAAGNIVEHFLSVICRIKLDKFNIITDNKAPDKYENYLRALFNQMLSEDSDCSPDLFNHALNGLEGSKSSTNLVDWYNSLMPTSIDLKCLSASIEKDRASVNSLLMDCGQPILKPSHPKGSYQILEDELHDALSDLSKAFMLLASRNMHLSRQIADLKKRLS